MIMVVVVVIILFSSKMRLKDDNENDLFFLYDLSVPGCRRLPEAELLKCPILKKRLGHLF